MAIATWPTGIPQLFQPDGFRIQPRPGTIRSEPDILSHSRRAAGQRFCCTMSGGPYCLITPSGWCFWTGMTTSYSEAFMISTGPIRWTRPKRRSCTFTEDPEITLIGSLQYVLTVAATNAGGVMARQVSTVLKNAIYRSDAGQRVFITLIEISHADLAAPLRFHQRRPGHGERW